MIERTKRSARAFKFCAGIAVETISTWALPRIVLNRAENSVSRSTIKLHAS
jgi:hypothetical protein